MNEHYTEAETPVIAKKVLAMLETIETDGATVLALSGDLGAGKTTLTKEIAILLGIEETLVSPTFVIGKFYRAKKHFDRLAHIDAYRIESLDELVPLGWNMIMSTSRTLVIIEWPERIIDAIPDDALWLKIDHEREERTITSVSADTFL